MLQCAFLLFGILADDLMARNDFEWHSERSGLRSCHVRTSVWETGKQIILAAFRSVPGNEQYDMAPRPALIKTHSGTLKMFREEFQKRIELKSIERKPNRTVKVSGCDYSTG